VQFKPVPPEEYSPFLPDNRELNDRLALIKNAKKKKEKEKKEQEFAARKQLANVRVIQKNLVYVLGLPAKVCSEEILRQNDYFGQYGKILKIVINRRPTTNAQGQTVVGGVYITYARKEDATKAIEAVDSSICDGRVIRATYGTTKYCSYYLRNQPCQNTLCQYLHEPGEEADAYAAYDILPNEI
jgi:RNA recognition motif-containing protein